MKRPWKCPVCDGAGLVSRPPYIAGDVQGWVSSDCAPHPCKPCVGIGIIWSDDGELKETDLQPEGERGEETG